MAIMIDLMEVLFFLQKHYIRITLLLTLAREVMQSPLCVCLSVSTLTFEPHDL